MTLAKWPKIERMKREVRGARLSAQECELLAKWLVIHAAIKRAKRKADRE